ncbi:hypothetical protein L484_018693 [Morus notabilis]|uniref:Uncharacterized protein n=1 Tax=Morus notabilis TaxID=981085 RepID=W9S9X3_9ROSA|nr:hypothetical protein L484_018693 [Morus notabilis]
MHYLKPLLCTLVLLGVTMDLLSLSFSEARPLQAALSRESRPVVPLMEAAKRVLDESIQRNGGNPYELLRKSPSGPDPRHH